MSEFAPLYTTRERIRLVLKTLAIALPVYLLAQFWLFPWLKVYAERAHCDFFAGITGLQLLIYATFAGLPLSLGLIIWCVAGTYSIAVLRAGQFPLPGEKVLRKTRYRYGNAARIQPTMILFVLILLFGVTVWGAYQANRLTQEIPDCDLRTTDSVKESLQKAEIPAARGCAASADRAIF